MTLSPIAVPARATRPAPDRRAPVRPAHPQRHLVSVPTGAQVPVRESHPSRLVLTRRGRVLIGLVVAAVFALTLAIAPFGGASEPVTVGTVTVQAGQTLSEIAARELPGVPVANAVVLIQRHNRLASTEVHAGQSLQIPGR
ncbi:LysM peptidoglycan-binding domain-containing protein [Janibacter sp. GXQ6167]|uniref:LysM peptidoglycan-binding domain-containing protein n=1 Tax=Janibacter sp. GXQ6167 TaxID=3240791 RepID=UPI0035261F00